MKSCGLYLHIPFCVQKCNYCDFVSVQYHQELAEQYLLALFSELMILAEKYHQPVIETIYLGGGTPTCLSGEKLASILQHIKEHFPLKESAEITCEVNPITGFDTDFKIIKDSGINRLSIGVQSFQDRLLKYLGRVHDLSQVYETVETVKKVGFENINLDLIFAIPTQSRADWQSSLKAALSLNPTHLSLYNLKIEENTPFYQDYQTGKLFPVDEETDLWMYQEAIKLLTEAGFFHYEISNFAKMGYQAKHNLCYWHYLPYLGVGAGAHGFTGLQRYENCTDLKEYINMLEKRQLPLKEITSLSEKDKMEEFVFMGLRLLCGISLSEFEKRFGSRFLQIYHTQIKKLSAAGLIRLEKDRLVLTERGLYLGNEVFAEFIL